jgi:hypothetical protein
MMAGVIVLGISFGLVLLPVLLSEVGPIPRADHAPKETGGAGNGQEQQLLRDMHKVCTI